MWCSSRSYVYSLLMKYTVEGTGSTIPPTPPQKLRGNNNIKDATYPKQTQTTQDNNFIEMRLGSDILHSSPPCQQSRIIVWYLNPQILSYLTIAITFTSPWHGMACDLTAGKVWNFFSGNITMFVFTSRQWNTHFCVCVTEFSLSFKARNTDNILNSK